MLLREIEVFRAVMAAGSTSKAAALLGVSQPAVSQLIRKLEAHAALQLFDRVRGRLVPTREAIALLDEVDRCFVGMELIEHRIRTLRSGAATRLRVAAYPAFGNGFLPRAIARMARADGTPRLSLQIMSSRDVYQNVLAGRFDMGLMADETAATGLEHHAFAQLQGVVVMPRGHALAHQPVVQASDLVAAPFVALNPEDPSRRRLEARLGELDVQLDPIVETPYASTVCELALAGVGIGLVNPIVALDYVDRGLLLRPFAMNVAFSCITVFRPGNLLGPGARELLRCMRQQLAFETHRTALALQGGAVVGNGRSAQPISSSYHASSPQH